MSTATTVTSRRQEELGTGTYDNGDNQQKGGQARRRGAHQWQAMTSGGTSASGFSHRATTAATAWRWRHGSRARRRHSAQGRSMPRRR
ncbi:hypothetical protein E2562_010819 [Oryza meyeriana var. granulata]|uniref:Uncharacterized protein n=1 Tax=Oryza meyeriana var. granulata TaxID=110450 RepID=A0A6G1BJL5_9ORYZ|nr:hypothetical protein E2562_010819 [Oryza meyeriana var. granulata]